MAPRSLLSPFLSSLLLLLVAAASPHLAASRGLFLKLPLLHRPSGSPSPHLLRRDRSAESPVTSGAPFGTGQYFVALHLGTPPQRLLLVADTGSDLVWARCSACRGGSCARRAPGSAFLARRSSSFRPHHCYSASCRLVPRPSATRCNRTHLHSACRYEYTYSDGSLSSGFFSRETVTLNTTSAEAKTAARLKGLAFGCGFRVSGPSITGSSFNGAQGVMGLGRGPISFASQLGRRFGSNKFSYCLMDYTLSPPPTSYLIIGDGPREENSSSSSSSSLLAFTPLLANPLSPTFYYVGIKRVHVDGERLPIDPSVWSLDELGNGGTIIDSGTTLTFLAERGYHTILAAIRRRVELPAAERAPPGFDLCVNVTGIRRPRLPRLSFEMEGEAVFAPPAGNYFIEVAEGVRCLAVRPAKTEGGGVSVIGNVMQQGFLWEFDTDKSRLGFSRRGCTAAS